MRTTQPNQNSIQLKTRSAARVLCALISAAKQTHFAVRCMCHINKRPLRRERRGVMSQRWQDTQALPRKLRVCHMQSQPRSYIHRHSTIWSQIMCDSLIKIPHIAARESQQIFLIEMVEASFSPASIWRRMLWSSVCLCVWRFRFNLRCSTAIRSCISNLFG